MQGDRMDLTRWADFNGDGKVDMICDNVDGGHNVLLSQGTQYLKTPGPNPGGWLYIEGQSTPINGWCVRTSTRVDLTIWADFNGDGKVDMICNNVDGGHNVLLSQATQYLRLPGSDPSNWLYLQGASTPVNNWCIRKNGRIDLTTWADFNGG
jgi:membrane-bound lytic murein transglycosylase B